MHPRPATKPSCGTPPGTETNRLIKRFPIVNRIAALWSRALLLCAQATAPPLGPPREPLGGCSEPALAPAQRRTATVFAGVRVLGQRGPGRRRFFGRGGSCEGRWPTSLRGGLARMELHQIP